MAALVHGGLSHVQRLPTSLDAVGFAGNVIVAKSIESGAARSDRGSAAGRRRFLGPSAFQRSILPCRCFKRWRVQFAPSRRRSGRMRSGRSMAYGRSCMTFA